MLVRALLAAAVTLGLTACEEIIVPGEDTTPIPGNYMVNRVNGQPIPAPGILLTIQPNGTFSGKGLCNSYSGASGRRLPSFRVASFKKGNRNCDQNIMRIEHDYFTALTQVSSVTQGSGGISLAGGDTDKRIRVDAVRVKQGAKKKKR